jgi:5-methylcytosine-specific restriction endonuclease McrA
MKKYKQVYLKGMNYDVSDFIPCEVCTSKAVDIHHIHRRGMGGNPNADVLENLMAVCRRCHDLYGDVPEYKELLTNLHNAEIRKRNRHL